MPESPKAKVNVYTPEYMNCVINCARLSSKLASSKPTEQEGTADLRGNEQPEPSEGPQKDDL